MFHTFARMNTALLAAVILAAISTAFAFLFLFLVARRAWQHFCARRFDSLSLKIHEEWREIVRGEIPAGAWRNDPVQCEILQSIVIQEIGAAANKDRAVLQEFLRASGLIARCIEIMRSGHGWTKRRAMLALGAMRVPEAIAPLAETLGDWCFDTRMTAVQALGCTRLAEAAEPIVEMHMAGKLKTPAGPVTNALVHCCMDRPEALLPHLRRSQGELREILARAASEQATAGMADEMIFLSNDPRPQVRACAAKALAVAPLALAIPALANLVRDDVWFVRLRAVLALNHIRHPRAIPILLEALRDTNRLIRMSAATILARFEHETVDILQNVVDSRDRYALHAMISALELGGGFDRVMAQLSDPMLHDEMAAMLLDALREGAAGLWTMHPANPVVESVFP